jgi:tRNA uridine 5-carboxymethylaminomethyl modification enzyme
VPIPQAMCGEPPAVVEEALYRVTYAGYLERERRQIEKLRDLEHAQLPKYVNYKTIKGLRNECAVKLAAIQPASLAQASRISGVNPADISVLLVWLRSVRNDNTSAPDS